jgi:hypothetical protein
LSLRFCSERKRSPERRLGFCSERERPGERNILSRRTQPLRRRVPPRFRFRFLGCERKRRAQRRTRARHAKRQRSAHGRILRCRYDPLSRAQVGARCASIRRSRCAGRCRGRRHQRLRVTELCRIRWRGVRWSFSATHRRRDIFASAARCDAGRLPLR